MSDGRDAVTLAGRHVSVTIPYRRDIQPAIDELRRMQEDLARRLPADPTAQALKSNAS